jgi:hypothetical protein
MFLRPKLEFFLVVIFSPEFDFNFEWQLDLPKNYIPFIKKHMAGGQIFNILLVPRMKIFDPNVTLSFRSVVFFT